MAKITICTDDNIVIDEIENVGIVSDLVSYNILKPIAQTVIVNRIIEAVTRAVKEEENA